jgi:arylsulfatase A-like enzyme
VTRGAANGEAEKDRGVIGHTVTGRAVTGRAGVGAEREWRLRSRVLPWVLLGGALALAACSAADPRPEPDQRPRNVILFVVDTLRADRLGCYGYTRPTSPAIDRMAALGTLYANNRSQAPWTVPSMISMHTGLYVTDEEQVLPPTHPTLAELFEERGLLTCAFIAKRGFERGFDHFDYIQSTRARPLVDRFLDWHRASGHRARAQDAGGEGPGFFAWLHALDPHHPYDPMPQRDVFRGPRPEQAELERRWRREEPRLAELSPELEPWDLPRAIEFIEGENNRYDGEVLAVDGAFEHLFQYLRAQDLLAETLIVFAADHGELLFEYPHYPLEVSLRAERDGGLPRGVVDLFAVGHRAWYHPELWNTPLVFCGPGFPRGQRRAGLSGNLDIFPTLVALFDLEVESGRPGLDLSGGLDPTRERIFAHGFETSAVLERDGLQLTEHLRRRFLLPDDAPVPYELFDLGPELARGVAPELLDLSAERPAQRQRLAAELERWRATYARPVTIDVPGRDAQEALRELGYLDD